MGNNSEDSSKQGTEEKLWTGTRKGRKLKIYTAHTSIIPLLWNWLSAFLIESSSFINPLLFVYMESFQVIAGIVKRMDKGADIENVGA